MSRRTTAVLIAASAAVIAWSSPLADRLLSPAIALGPGAGGCSYVTDSCDPTTTAVETPNVPITMDDGVILEADKFVPTTCTVAKQCPVVLIQTPYRKGASDMPGDLESPFAPEVEPWLYEHGYIEVVVDVRGTGSSEGYWDSMGPREQQDEAEVAEWVANPKNIAQSNGVVGLAGASYAGIDQLLTVEAINGDLAGHGPLTDPGSGCTTTATFDCGNPTHITTDPVKAITPTAAMSDAYRDITYAGGNIDASFIPLWLPLVQASSLEPPDESQSDPAVALNAESSHIKNLYLFGAQAEADGALGAYESLLPTYLQTYPDQAYDGPFYQNLSPITHIDRINVPTFLIGGTHDLFQRGEPILYEGIHLPPSEKKLIIGPWYHATTTTTLPATDIDGNPVINFEAGWFDHWLRGTDNHVETAVPVETYQMGADQWVPDTQYPATGTTGERWYLGSGGTLSRAHSLTPGTGLLPATGANGTCSRSTWQWFVGAFYGGPSSPVCENNSTPSETQGLTFTTAPFASRYTLSGPIEADIYMSSTAADSSVVATVSDVSASGTGGTTTSSDVSAGTLVASMRQVTTTRCGQVVRDCSVYLDGQSIEPWHPYTHATQATMEAGTIYELQIEILPTSQTFMPGHQMRLTITTSDVFHEAPTASTAVGSTGIDTFYYGGATPSSVYLGTTTPAQRAS